MELAGSVDSVREDRAPELYYLKRGDLTVTFTSLGQKKPGVVLALGLEAQTLRFEEFIDLWQHMIELAPKAADRHLAYMESSMRRNF